MSFPQVETWDSVMMEFPAPRTVPGTQWDHLSICWWHADHKIRHLHQLVQGLQNMVCKLFQPSSCYCKCCFIRGWPAICTFSWSVLTLYVRGRKLHWDHWAQGWKLCTLWCFAEKVSTALDLTVHQVFWGRRSPGEVARHLQWCLISSVSTSCFISLGTVPRAQIVWLDVKPLQSWGIRGMCHIIFAHNPEFSKFCKPKVLRILWAAKPDLYWWLFTVRVLPCQYEY